MFFMLPSALIAVINMPAPPPPLAAMPSRSSCAPPQLSTLQTPALWVAAPSGDASALPTQTSGSSAALLDIWRAADGLFYVDGAINGEPVRFVVDTGASMIVLTASDARRARVAINADAEQVEAQTVGGKRALTRVTLNSMQVGTTGVRTAPAVVADDGLGVSLLGQSWLAQLASVTIEGDRMRLRP